MQSAPIENTERINQLELDEAVEKHTRYMTGRVGGKRLSLS